VASVDTLLQVASTMAAAGCSIGSTQFGHARRDLVLTIVKSTRLLTSLGCRDRPPDQRGSPASYAAEDHIHAVQSAVFNHLPPVPAFPAG
jgi:hypothetical protein